MSSISRRGMVNPIKGGYKPRRINILRRNNAKVVGQRVTNAINKKKRIRARRNGVEVNRAEGGFKPMISRKKVQQIAVNYYAYLVALRVPNSDYGMMYTFEDAGTLQTSTYFDLNTKLKQCTEFQNYLNMSEQYKVFGVNISIDMNRVANAGDILPKMILYYDTDKITTKNPLTASNVMSLIMHKPGTKNYNVSLNKRNMDSDYIGWLPIDKAYDCKLQLHVGNTAKAYLTGDPTDKRLGTVKITFNVKFRLRDQQSVISEFQTIQQKIENFDLNTYKNDLKTRDMGIQCDIKPEMVNEGSECQLMKSDNFAQKSLVVYKDMINKPMQKKFSKQVELWKTLMDNCKAFEVDLHDLCDGDFNFSLNQLRLLHDRIKETLEKKGIITLKDLRRLQVVIECFSKFSNDNRKVNELTNDLRDFYDTLKDRKRIKEEEPKMIDYRNKLYTHNQTAKDDQEKEEKLDKKYEDKIKHLTSVVTNQEIARWDRRCNQMDRKDAYVNFLDKKLQLQEDRLRRREEDDRIERRLAYGMTENLGNSRPLTKFEKWRVENINRFKEDVKRKKDLEDFYAYINDDWQ